MNSHLSRQQLSKMLQLHGYSACRESLIILAEHFASCTKYKSLEHFINQLNQVITFSTDIDGSVIDPELAYLVTQKLSDKAKEYETLDDVVPNQDGRGTPEIQAPHNPKVRLKNVELEPVDQIEELVKETTVAQLPDKFHGPDFEIHYNYLFKKLTALPIFKRDFKLVKLSTLTGSSQPSIRCICFGLLIKDVTKIDGYTLIDGSCRVPVRITPETKFRNTLAYSNCIVLVEGVYINPNDILFAANIGLPPILLDDIPSKSLACAYDRLVVILREPFLDDDDVCQALELLFNGYNSTDEPPLLFILIGNFTRRVCYIDEFRRYIKKLFRIIRTCDKLKDSHFVFVPGPDDTSFAKIDASELQRKFASKLMPKRPFTKQQVPINLLQLAKFKNLYLATNPCHIYFGDRLISLVSHSYLKEIRKNLIHDMSDHNREFYETVRQIILSNAHLTAGNSKRFHSSLKLWQRPDLLVLGDTEAFGNRYDWSSSEENDTTFATLPSFGAQSGQFKVYYVRSGNIEDSQVSASNSGEMDLDSEASRCGPDVSDDENDAGK